jgi:ribosome maturation factor RimP
MPTASAGPPPDAARRQLRTLLTPVVGTAGYDLEDIVVSAAGRRTLVRVVVDADGGVDLDGIAVVSRAVAEALDAAAPGGPAFAGPYVLEVTSPGVDRPLTEPRHWRRARGRLVMVPIDGAAVTGRVLDVDDGGVSLEIGNSAERVSWDRLGRAKIQVEFNRPSVEGVREGRG